MSITYQKNMTNLLRYTSFGPSLNLVSGGELQNETPITFTRNTKRHYWDQSGILQTAAVDTLPTSYDPATGTKDGWPIMGQWTNEVLDPRDMTTGNWLDNGGVVRDAVGIDGETNSACTVTDDDGTSSERVRQNITITNNSNTHTLSVFVKKDDNTTRYPAIRYSFTGGTSLDQWTFIDTKNGSLVSNGVENDRDSHSIEDRGEFWRVTITMTNNSSGNNTLQVWLYGAASNAFDGFSDSGATGSAVFDAAQVFLNRSFPPPTPVYGETAGQSYTQDPDIATVTDLDAINFNSDEGTFIFEVNDVRTDSFGRIFTSYDSGVTRHTIFFDSNNRPSYRIRDINGNELLSDTGTDGDLDGRTIIAVAIKSGDSAIAIDGSIDLTSSTTGTPANLTEFQIGHDNEAQYANGFFKLVANYPRRLSNAQLQQLTS